MNKKVILKGVETDTQKALSSGLPGAMNRPVRVSIIGAGSNFTPFLVNDIFKIEGEVGGTIALVDIDKQRLDRMHRLISLLAERRNRKHWRIESTTDRCEVLTGTDYIIVCIEVSGLDCVRFDYDIPKKYGVDQCIGDTVGPGGVFKGLRTIPVFLDILSDAEKLCPKAIVLNYTNPMNMMITAAARYRNMQVVGLCHSVQGTSQLLAKRAGVPYDEIQWDCAGINHLAWFTKLEHKDRNLYPDLMAKARKDLAGNPVDPEDANDLVRKDMMLHFGAFITESSPHLSEYVPYYRHRGDIMEKYCHEEFPGKGSRVGSSYYADMWPEFRSQADKDRESMIDGDKSLPDERTWEYASWIIESREKNCPYGIHGNVMNKTGSGSLLIENLSADGCVEVECVIDRNGIRPVPFGKLPVQMAALCAAHMPVYDLAAEAAVHGRKDLAIQAMMLDPLTAAVCCPAEIQSMANEMFEAEMEFLPTFQKM